MKKIIIDLDGTLTNSDSHDYSKVTVNTDVLASLNEYRKLGFYIVIHTARNMRTYENNVGKINKNTLPNIISWLEKNKVEYDEVIVGKPWCGDDGFYVDDRAIRPSEFANLNYNEIVDLLDRERRCF